MVVKKDSGLTTLASLKGRSFTMTVGTSEPVMRFVAESVFRSEIDPRSWFGAIAQETDDFTSIAAVLYGRTDAALVSEDNPLLANHLDKDLVSVYTSPAVSLPVIAVRVGVFTPAQMSAARIVGRWSREPTRGGADPRGPGSGWIQSRSRKARAALSTFSRRRAFAASWKSPSR